MARATIAKTPCHEVWFGKRNWIGREIKAPMKRLTLEKARR
jgi:hypothetical protein